MSKKPILAGKTRYCTDPDLISINMKQNKAVFGLFRKTNKYEDVIVSLVGCIILWICSFGAGLSVLLMICSILYFMGLFAIANEMTKWFVIILTFSSVGMIFVMPITNLINPVITQRFIKKIARFSLFYLRKPTIVEGVLGKKHYFYTFSPDIYIELEMTGDYKKYCKSIEWSAIHRIQDPMPIFKRKKKKLDKETEKKFSGVRKLWVFFEKEPKKGKITIKTV